LLELRIGFTNGAELGLDEASSSFLNQLEETQVLDASHLDNLCNAMANPPFAECAPELATGECEDWWVVRALEVLEALAVAAGAW